MNGLKVIRRDVETGEEQEMPLFAVFGGAEYQGMSDGRAAERLLAGELRLRFGVYRLVDPDACRPVLERLAEEERLRRGEETGRVVRHNQEVERRMRMAKEETANGNGAEVPAAEPKAKEARPRKEREKGGLDYAYDVMAKAGKPMGCKEIAKLAVEAGWRTEGATPHATLSAAIGKEIKTKGEASRFLKAGKGEYSAR